MADTPGKGEKDNLEVENAAWMMTSRVRNAIDARLRRGLTSELKKWLRYPPRNRTEQQLDELYEALNGLGVYSKIPHCTTRDVAVALTRTAMLESYKEKTLLFATGDPGNCFYIILEGSVRIFVVNPVTQLEFTLFVQRAVNAVGETAVETRGNRGAHVAINEEGTLLLKIGVDEFWDAAAPVHRQNVAERMHVLRKVPYLRDLSDEALKKVASKVALRIHYANQCICNQGLVANEAYVILGGEVSLIQSIWVGKNPQPMDVDLDTLKPLDDHTMEKTSASATEHSERAFQMAALHLKKEVKRVDMQRAAYGKLDIPSLQSFTLGDFNAKLLTVEMGQLWKGGNFGDFALLSKPKEQLQTALARTPVKVMVLTRNDLLKTVGEEEMAKIEAHIEAAALVETNRLRSKICSLVSDEMTWNKMKQELVYEQIKHRVDEEELRRRSSDMKMHWYRNPKEPTDAYTSPRPVQLGQKENPRKPRYMHTYLTTTVEECINALNAPPIVIKRKKKERRKPLLPELDIKTIKSPRKNK